MDDIDDVKSIEVRVDEGLFITFFDATGKQTPHVIEVSNSYDSGLAVVYTTLAEDAEIVDVVNGSPLTLGNEIDLWNTSYAKMNTPQPGDIVYFTSGGRLAAEGIVVCRMNEAETLVQMVLGDAKYALRTQVFARKNETSWVAPVEVVERARQRLKEPA